jgi:hypothetical protein
MNTVQNIQSIFRVPRDGIWGPKSQAALNRAIARTGAKGDPTLAKIQKLLGVEPDGFWGPISQEALSHECDIGGGEFDAVASSFADPADVQAFQVCKVQGKSDQACFKLGDNGIGQFGRITAQTHTPMVAIHKDDMIARWGSVDAAAHRVVIVTIRGKTIRATVEDRLGVPGRIDLNPAAAKQFGLEPPFLERDCRWRWG